MSEPAIDYASEYADYWSRDDRYGTHSFNSPESIVRQILNACGVGSVLDVGCGMGLLVETLVATGVDARGIDVAQRVVEHDNKRLPARFQQASALELPFPDASFDTLISTDFLEHIGPADIAKALREMARVTRRNLFVRLVTRTDRDSRRRITVQQREWWEQRFFEAGFRKHPNSLRVNSYEALEHDPGRITMLMEKIPPRAFQKYAASLAAPPEVNDLPLDMLRGTDRLFDAEFARYHLAGQYVRPGDTVLEIGAGAAAGLHVLRNNSPAARLIALQPNALAVEYAQANFGEDAPTMELRAGDHRAALASWSDHSVDVVIAFDIFDHEAEPYSLLREIARILIPGGRLILSARCASVAGASDGLTFEKMQSFFGPELLSENVYQQRADPSPDAASKSGAPGRWLRQLSCPPHADAGGQWWIATAINDPLRGAAIPYRETVFANLAAAVHPSTQYARWYRNPWIVHSLVHVGYRVKSASLLTELAGRLLAGSPVDSPDYGAALCILAYQLTGASAPEESEIETLIGRILPYLELPIENPHVYRWQISLTFVIGQLELKRGLVDPARLSFQRCSEMDPFLFGIHLATKSAESFFWSGWLALCQGDSAMAERVWKSAIDFGNRLIARPVDEVLMNPADPNIFDHGDGMREFVHAIESIGKCVNGIHLLMREREGRVVNWDDIHGTFRGRAEQSSRDLRDAQSQGVTLTAELVQTRAELLARTEEVDLARADLARRTADLGAACQDLVSRTAELDIARQDLISRTAELDAARHDLISRTAELDAARQELISRTVELDTARQDLISRTIELDKARQALNSRTTELDATRQLRSKSKRN